MEFHVPIPDREFHGIKFLWNSIEFHGNVFMEFYGIPCPNTRQNSMDNFPSNSTEFHGISPWGYFTRAEPEAKTCKYREAWENACKQVMIGYGLTSD